MAVITELSHTVIENALEQYDIGKLMRFKPATQGIENTNYFITSRSSENGQSVLKDYVFTVVEELGGDAISRQIMVSLLSDCNEAGLPVPVLVRTKHGDRECRAWDKPILICEKLPGAHITHPVVENCEAIGRFLARFHLVTRTIASKAKPYIRNVDWLTRSVETVEPFVSPDQRFYLRKVLEVLTSLLSRTDVQSLPQSVIHGDLFRDNALFNSHGLSGVVDFYHAGVGYEIYDIAVAINDWCEHHGTIDERRASSLLSAYNQIRPLTGLEATFLNQFLLYGAFSFWLSRLLIQVRDELPDDYPVKDPRHFEELVDRHLRRPFRLTEPETITVK